MGNYQEVLSFWFGDLQNNLKFPARQAKLWYRKDPKVDEYIQTNYLEIWNRAANNQLEHWKQESRGWLALVIVLDQFTRHLFRDRPQAFSQDSLALQLSLQALDLGMEQNLLIVERAFLYMPLEHSETIEMQQKSVGYFKKLVADSPPEIREQISGFYEYALQHHDIIQKFGRFPHRNAILSRQSTEEEIRFLQRPNSRF